MPNHFHLVVETPQANLVAGMTMTLKWIADRLKMGTWTHVSNRFYHLKK
jgi:REP element-mobilizing transposase RayT